MNNSIENQIARLEQELKTLKELVNKPKEKWQPRSLNGQFFLLDIIKCHPEEQVDRGLVYYNPCDALEKSNQLIQFTRLMKFAHERNGNWKPDWNNPNEIKYYPTYNHYQKTWVIAQSRINSTIQDIYLKNESDAQELADLLNNGLF